MNLYPLQLLSNMPRPKCKGSFIDSDGYVIIRIDKPHPRGKPKRKQWVKEHIIIMEKHLGRYLQLNEVIHHKDKNRQNNDISNLQLMTKGQHKRLHVRKDMTDRVCSLCSKDTSAKHKVKTLSGIVIRPHWFKDRETGKIICGACYQRRRYNNWV